MTLARAVDAWKAGTEKRFDFMILAGEIVGSPQNTEGGTQELAALIRRSPDTVERYAKGGLLYMYVTGQEPSKSEILREALDYEYWKKLGWLYHKGVVSLNGSIQWLEEAKEHKWTYEKFRSLLPTVESGSVWKKSAKKGLKHMNDFLKVELIDSPAFDIDVAEYKKVRRALLVASKRIEKAIK